MEFRKVFSFILAGILYRKFMFFFALRKKLLRSGKVLKTHATPTPALFIQKTPQKCQEKNLPRERNTHFLFSRERNTYFPSLGKFFSGEIHFLTLFSVFLFGLGGRLKHSLRAGNPSKLKESTILDQKRIFTLEVVSCSDKSVSSGGL